MDEQPPTPEPAPPRASHAVARFVWIVIVMSLVMALVTTLAFVVTTLTVRVPYWGEAEVLFEASRLRAHLPLFVDPLIGAHDYGQPPSRYYVTYPPVWSWIVSRACSTDASSIIFVRVAATFAWFGSLASIAYSARRDSRAEATVAAAFVAGIWVLANFATIGRPDAIACAIAAVALARSMRKGTVDDVSVVLFMLVPWVKPTIIGLPLAAIIAGAVIDRSRTWRTIRTAVTCALASVAVAHVATSGSIFMHVVRSNAQPFSIDAWLDQVPSRLLFFMPLIAWAAWVAYRDRATVGTKIGLVALVGATTWTLFALAKTGSSSNYWMEPCIAAVVVIANAAPGPLRVNGDNVAHAIVVLACVVWTDIAALRGSMEHMRSEKADAAIVASLRDRCAITNPKDLVAADEAGIELATNGRILIPTYQMVHLVRSGLFPADLWASDLKSPSVRCYVEHSGQLRLAPELQRSLEENFEATPPAGGFTIWKRR